MLVPHARASVHVVFSDRERNERQTSLSLPFSLSIELIHEFMALWIANVLPLTNAAIVRYEITHTLEDDDPQIATGDSLVWDRLVLYYRTGPRYDALYIPAIKYEMLELLGPYAGIRLDTNLPTVQDALGGMLELLGQVLTPEGGAWPLEFVAGGLVL